MTTGAVGLAARRAGADARDVTGKPSPSRARLMLIGGGADVRRLTAELLEGDSRFVIAGSSASADLGISAMKREEPDAVILDITEEAADGPVYVKALRAAFPRLPILFFTELRSGHTRLGLQVLEAGANDCLTRPANLRRLSPTMKDGLRTRLVGKLVALSRNFRAADAVAVIDRSNLPAREMAQQRPLVVTLCASTGGPKALGHVFSQIKAPVSVPILVVQHMSRLFTDMLSTSLNLRCPLEVVEATHGMQAKPGQVVLAPGDHHMVASRDGSGVVISLNQGPQENFCRPAADVLLRSLAEHFGSRAAAFVMTGLGSDGLRGAEQLVKAGGRVFAQDEATSVVWSMPGHVVRAGLAETVLPLPEIPIKLQSLVR